MTRTILAAMLFACPASTPTQTYYVQCLQESVMVSAHCVTSMGNLPECEWLNVQAVGREHCADLVQQWLTPPEPH